MSSAKMPVEFDPLKDQLLSAAKEFAGDQSLEELLTGLVDDVERAYAEGLEIFPVCHHSPSSALHMVRRLRAKPPKVIYMECCEDMRPMIDGLKECRMPVAIQSFSADASAFPGSWSPLSLVCPLTEFSAEYQAIAYAMENPDCELVFVDRSTDHVFQWMPQEDAALEDAIPADPDSNDDDAAMHGSSVGVQIGGLPLSFGDFRDFLLKNARMAHFTEWWDQYVEEAIIGRDYGTYRQVMFLIGSLFRRLGTDASELRSDEERERYMWTRMKQHLRDNDLDADDAIYICGAAHAASYVEEFGIESEVMWDIPPATDTKWMYGLLPSSYSAIEHQFGQPRGSITMAEARWKKGLKKTKLKAFAIAKPTKKSVTGKATPSKAPTKVAKPAAPPVLVESPDLIDYLNAAPDIEADSTEQQELLKNCVRLVGLARKNGYLSSTADAIAVYQTSILLAQMRNRMHPTPYDFRDAAITCVEKDMVPGKRDVGRLCDMLFGGDRTGQIGYESLPPLAKNIYDRLAVLPINLTAKTVQRALLDFRKDPSLLPASKLLWQLRYLIDDYIVRPIMGQCELGYVPQQESWDISIGKYQGAVIELGYEGVTVEHVLEQRLKRQGFGPGATAVLALDAVEKTIVLLGSERLAEELGERAIELLVNEPDVKDAQAIYKQISRLIHHYRAQPGGMPVWCEHFVTTGYSHYSTLLPNAFADRGVKPEDLTAMLQFIFTLESMALSLGCERSQLVIAIQLSATGCTDPTKQALLWSAECVLRLQSIGDVRTHLNKVIDNEMTLPTLPGYLSGFLLALAFTPMIGRLTVELMSNAFERLPDRILMPWLPQLLMMLRPHADVALPVLLKEANGAFPKSLSALMGWTAPWAQTAEASPASADSHSGVALDETAVAVRELLWQEPAAANALAVGLGLDTAWQELGAAPAAAAGSAAPGMANPAVTELLNNYPDTLKALA